MRISKAAAEKNRWMLLTSCRLRASGTHKQASSTTQDTDNNNKLMSALAARIWAANLWVYESYRRAFDVCLCFFSSTRIILGEKRWEVYQVIKTPNHSRLPLLQQPSLSHKQENQEKINTGIKIKYNDGASHKTGTFTTPIELTAHRAKCEVKRRSWKPIKSDQLVLIMKMERNEKKIMVQWIFMPFKTKKIRRNRKKVRQQQKHENQRAKWKNRPKTYGIERCSCECSERGV